MEFQNAGIRHFYQDHPAREAKASRKSEALVLIHGFPHTYELWNGQVGELSRENRVITYDVRGHGKSGAGDGHFLLEFFVDDLIALLDHLKLRQVAVAGLSMGGYIALRAVERSPERFSALLLCNTQSGADTNPGKLKRAAAIRMIREKGFDAFVEDFIEGVLMPETLARDPGSLDRFRQMVRRNSPENVCRSLIALAARTDQTDSLGKIRIPTLIIAGEKDQVTPVEGARFMHERIAGSRLEVIPGVGHLSGFEKPREFNDAMLAFLRELP